MAAQEIKSYSLKTLLKPARTLADSDLQQSEVFCRKPVSFSKTEMRQKKERAKEKRYASLYISEVDSPIGLRTMDFGLH